MLRINENALIFTYYICDFNKWYLSNFMLVALWMLDLSQVTSAFTRVAFWISAAY